MKNKSERFRRTVCFLIILILPSASTAVIHPGRKYHAVPTLSEAYLKAGQLLPGW